MSVEISFGGVCRDIAKLPQDEAAFRAFYTSFVEPAVFEDFRKNFLMATGARVDTTRAFDAELQNRGCEVGGSVSIRF